MARPDRRIEVEWQFAVRDVEAFRRWLERAPLTPWSVAPAGVATLRDGYFDTSDWCIRQAGYALRVRTSGEQVEATLKAVRPARGGAARRREITERLADARLATLRAARGVVGRRLARLLGTEKLRRLFTLRTHRRTYVVRDRRRTVAELALDRTVIAAPHRRPRRLQRVELEVKAARPAAVAPLAATLRRTRRLTPARRSKFEEGLRTAGLGSR